MPSSEVQGALVRRPTRAVRPLAVVELARRLGLHGVGLSVDALAEALRART
ncbi:hypothetical protein [Georgenia sp. SUBG003]|uniref:hypothetical protein n=1 Tax=Georgenia sp. SUBG003 TaxID=1497974 RepID=UPI003AB43689